MMFGKNNDAEVSSSSDGSMCIAGVKSINEYPKGDEKALSIDDEPELKNSDLALIELGYKPELKREYSMFSAFSFAVSISGLFATVATSFVYPLMAGGSACVIWAWAIAGAGCVCIGLSVAEIVSSVPSSGGLYFACSKLFPPRIAPYICWLDGWLNLLGQIACCASSEFGGAQMLLSAVSMGTDFKYTPTAGHTVGVSAALLAFHGFINCMPAKWVEKVSKSYVVFHYAVLLIGAIVLLARTHPKHEASYVFAHVESNSGWTPIGWSFMFGFLSVSWTMTDYDAPAHLCEEMEEPEIKAPWAIAGSTLFTYVLGFLYNVVLCFCLGDPSQLLSSTLPVATIYYNSLGKGGGIAFTVFMFVVMNCTCVAVLQSVSRTIWSQARDNMYPGVSKYVYKVNKLTHIPVNAVITGTVICILINLIALGSMETINAIFSVTSIAIDWSCCIPIAGKILFPKLQKKGPWNLGKFSLPVNVYACLWTLYASIVFFCPTNMPVTPQNMNYAVVFFVFIVAGSTLCWVCGARKLYKGPSATAPDSMIATVLEAEDLKGFQQRKKADEKSE